MQRRGKSSNQRIAPMNSLLNNARNLRRRYWLLIIISAFYIVYIALAYFYLPGRLKQVVVGDVSQMIGREIALDRININPFAVSIRVFGFAIADKPGKPLLGWHQFFVNVGFWKSIFKREVALDEVSIDQPEINIEKHTDHYNFTEIFDRFNTEPAPENNTDQPPDKAIRLALEVFHTNIKQGIFRFLDLTGSSEARFHLDNINIEFKELYLATGDEHLNPFELGAAIPGGGEIRLTGQYRIDPLHVDAEVAANGVELSSFSGFVENILPMKVNGGKLSFSTRVLAQKDGEFQFRLNEGGFRFAELTLDDDIDHPSLLRAGSIEVKGVAFDLLQKAFTIQDVTLDGITTNQWLDTMGKLRYEKSIQKPPGTPKPQPDVPTEPPQTPGAPWHVLIKHLGLKNGTLNFSDQKKEITVDHSLSEVTLSLENVTFDPNEKMTVQFSTLLDGTGRIGVTGGMVLSPFSMNLDYQLENIKLLLFSEYLETASFMRIDRGSLSAKGALVKGVEEKAPLTARFDLALNDFQVADTRSGGALFRFNAFELDDFLLNLDEHRISLSTVTFKKPVIFAERSSEKTTNLGTLSKSGKAVSKGGDQGKSIEPEAPSDWTFSIKESILKDGAVHYADHSVSPIFKTALSNLSLSLGPLATYGAGDTPFTFTGKLDQYAPFALKGTLATSGNETGLTFTSSLEGLEMPGLSPYSAAFIGNNLRSGKLSLNLDYSLKNRKLKGKNHIVAEKLYLGDKVPGDPAVKVPVALGLALLRDTRGVIDLNVGVSGDLDDPGFSVSGVVIKALVNIITKAVASPFKLLGALAGGPEDLGEIAFREGQTTLDKENETRLKQLAEALKKRPQLALVVKGNAGMEVDGMVLQTQDVLKQIAAARKMTTEALLTTTENTNWWMLPKNRDVLEGLNTTLKFPSASERASKHQKENSALKGEALTVAVYREMLRDVTAAQKIDPGELMSLADRRAMSIKQYLVDGLGLDHQRVSMKKPLALTGRTVFLELGAL